jgi:SagB-type dehydrogenase family enzyme
MDTPDIQQAAISVGPSEIQETAGPCGAYIHWLRTEFARGRWAADPSRPSLLYKVYQGAQSVPLDGEIPLHLGQDFDACWHATLCRQQRARPVQKLSWLLSFTHGVIRRVRPIAGKATLPGGGQISGPVAHFAPTLGRPVPSGGNLHPVELYLAVNQMWGLPAGLYHYDSAHHALDYLRSGDALSPIAACLPDGTPPGSAVVLLSICIQKNSQKYTSLSYLLQTLDTGIVLEQLCFVATRLGLAPDVHLCFLDRSLHALVGLAPAEEQVYALVLLGQGAACTPATGADPLTPLSASPVQPFVPRSPEPLLQQLYLASLLESFPQDSDLTSIGAPAEGEERAHEVALPALHTPASRRDLAHVLLRRHTSAQAIDPGAITCQQLAAILHWPGRLKRPLWHLFACQIYCVASRVSDLPPDVYAYSRERHSLRPLATPAFLPLLIRLSTGSNVQPYLSPALLFFCGNYQQAHATYGERGLRLLGIEIGRMVQDVALCAAYSGLGVHIHVSTALEGIRTRLLQDTTPASLPFASMMVGHPRNAEENFCEALWY